MKNLLLFIVLSLSISLSLFSQQASLSGKIIEAKTKEPLLFAAVALYQNGVLKNGKETDFDGNYVFNQLDPGLYDIEVSYIGFETKRIEGVLVYAAKAVKLDIELEEEGVVLDMVCVKSYKVPLVEQSNSTQSAAQMPTRSINGLAATTSGLSATNARTSRNEHENRSENTFVSVRKNRYSTFGIDVDRASYSIVRNYLKRNSLPPANAVRAEEMINYFTYDYAESTNQHPFAVHSEWANCPWNEDHLLLSVALQGKRSDIHNLPNSNLTFLLDVSGSMGAANKLDLVKSSMRILLDQLRPSDKVSIVVYAGAAGLVLPPTAVVEKDKILGALNRLKSGGSTAGGAGIQLAYKTAREQFMPNGNNRIILATDGDFNVGISDIDALEEMIEEEKDAGVFLTVLGFGMGNLKDNKMERLADKGNGMYAYIDTKEEARKVFEVELTSSLFTIAKDVKLQLNFNKKAVQKYRLIGYENRLLNKEDFDDDTKDAGELGAGHSVTALYEVVPTKAFKAPLDLKLRYKRPHGHQSYLLRHKVEHAIKPFAQASNNMRWAAAVASYSMLLTASPYKGNTNFELIQNWASNARGSDEFGFRKAFIEQVQLTEELHNRIGTASSD